MPRKAEPRMCNRIRELRAERQMTQQDLADAIGVTRQTVVAIERGGYVPSLALAMRISETFSQSVEAVFWIAK